MHSLRAPAGVSCLRAQVINEMLNQWFNKTLFSIFSSQTPFAFSSDVASPQSSTWGGVLRWHSHKPIVASWAVDYGDPRRKEVGAPWDKQNGPPGSSGTDSVGPVTPRGVRCCITSIPSIRGGGVEGWGGFTLAGEPRLVTPLHTHCGGRAPAKYITALHRWLRWNRITKYITALHRQWHQWNLY